MPPTLLPSSADLLPFLPEVTLLCALLLILLIPLLSPKKNILAVAITAAAGIVGALLASIPTWFIATGAPAPCFHRLLLLDPFAWSVKILILLFVLIVLALWFTDSHDKFLLRGQSADAPEFFLLLLSATLGLCLMASTSNLLMIFLAIELASLPSYVLAGFRKNHRPGAEASLKYVLFGAAAAAIMLYGISLLYGLSGSLDLSAIAASLAHFTLTFNRSQLILLAFASLALLAGIGFKIAMVPLHFWCPDVFEGAPIDIATFLSVASKAAGLALLARILILFAATPAAHPLAVAILLLGALTCFWGNLAACSQTNIKRLLAFSSIAHAGYMLIAVAALAPTPPQSPAWRPAAINPAADALLFYLAMYLFMNAGAFVAAAAIAQRLAGPNTPGMSLGVERILLPPSDLPLPNISGEDLSHYTGLSRRAPLLAAAMLLFLLSLTGIPLTIGFGAKLKLIATLFNAAPYLRHWTWFALAAVGLNTVIAAFYYFRVIRQMYLRDSDPPAPRLIEIAPVSILALLLLIPNIALFLAYSPVDSLLHTQSATLNPQSQLPPRTP